MKILSPLIIILMLFPALGININTHICGETEDAVNSLVIPGLIEAEECDKCHEVVIVKSCCSSEKESAVKKIEIENKEKGCCKDFLSYSTFKYISSNKTLIKHNLSLTINLIKLYQSFFLIDKEKIKISENRTRLRPYSPTILPFICTFLI
jgi:hypothetical protein